MATNKLSANDQDLILARKLEKFIRENRNLAEIDDAVISDLLAYRQNCKANSMSVSANGQAVWARIEKETAPVSATSYFLTNQWAWATAAIILVAAFTAIFFVIQPGQSTLLAETGTQMELVQLRDGSEVTLRPHSSLYEVQYSDEAQRYQLSGEGYFSVASASDRIFSVESEHGRAEVLGTDFVMRDWGGITRVYLKEGLVRFETSDRSQSVILQPGQSSAISSADGLFETDTADSTEYMGWTRNELTFLSRPASFVFSELEHHFQITIEASEAIMNEILGGTISLDERKQSLKDLGDVLNGQFVTKDEKTYTFILN
ncbi:MAG: FecR domain-containing protein [Balneolales bacterium]